MTKWSNPECETRILKLLLSMTYIFIDFLMWVSPLVHDARMQCSGINTPAYIVLFFLVAYSICLVVRAASERSLRKLRGLLIEKYFGSASIIHVCDHQQQKAINDMKNPDISLFMWWLSLNFPLALSSCRFPSFS